MPSDFAKNSKKSPKAFYTYGKGIPISEKLILINLIYKHVIKNLPHLRLYVLRE